MASLNDGEGLREMSRNRSGEQSNLPALFFLGLITFSAFLLLFLVPTQTRWFPRVHFYLQPGFQAYVVLITMAFFSSIAFIIELMRLKVHKGRQATFLGLEIFDWFRSVEYALWFVAYAFVIPIFGYLPATLTFMLLLGTRVGIRSIRQLTLLALIGFSTVVFFRGLLSVKMPVGQYYEFLPDPFRDIAIMAL